MNQRSGPHLGALRSWLQLNAHRGEHLTWGSEEIVALRPQTVRELEDLAERIANAALRDMFEMLTPKCCDDFIPEPIVKVHDDGDTSIGGNFGICGNCGHRRQLHDLKKEVY